VLHRANLIGGDVQDAHGVKSDSSAADDSDLLGTAAWTRVKSGKPLMRRCAAAHQQETDRFPAAQ